MSEQQADGCRSCVAVGGVTAFISLAVLGCPGPCAAQLCAGHMACWGLQAMHAVLTLFESGWLLHRYLPGRFELEAVALACLHLGGDCWC